MEFVNNSNCDNNTNSVSSKLVQKGIQANSKDDLLYFVCRLVAYLVANIVHDEKEWREWGLPFIRMNLIANFDVTKGEQLLAELEQKFCPLIGHGLSLILEEHNYDNSDSISNSDHGYVYIQKADEFFYLFLCDLNNVNNNTLTNTASTVRDDSNDTEDMKSGINLDELLSSYLLNFFEFSISHAAYDARSRTVAKKMFELFQISSSKFTKLEMSLWERCKTSFRYS